MLERRKSRNRQLTQQAPFVFHTPRPARSTVRQPRLSKDPTSDWRFARPRSAGAAASPSWRQVVDRLSAAPPRSTEKTRQWQHQRRLHLQELAERERRAQEAAEPASARASSEMRRRVKEAAAAAGPVEPLQERIDRIVADKRQDSALLHQRRREDLEQIRRRVSHRPLLMEQADSAARARRLATQTRWADDDAPGSPSSLSSSA